jgi:hypothetical protein
MGGSGYLNVNDDIAKVDVPGKYPVKVVWESGLIEFLYANEDEIFYMLTGVGKHGVPMIRVLPPPI